MFPDPQKLLVGRPQLFGRTFNSSNGSKFTASGRSGRWASFLRQRCFRLYQNVLRIILITSASLGTESKEASRQRVIDLFESLNYSEHLWSGDQQWTVL